MKALSIGRLLEGILSDLETGIARDCIIDYVRSLVVSQQEVRQNIFLATIRHWGADSQIRMAIEELAELIVVLSKISRDDTDYGALLIEIGNEVADVEIMCRQLRVLFDLPNKDWQSGQFSDYVDSYKEFALGELERRLANKRAE